MQVHQHNRISDEMCDNPSCPFSKTITDLDRTVFKGNGAPALTVQISNLATKIDTTQRLVIAAIGAIPIVLMLLQWGASAMGLPIHVIAGGR